MQHTTAGRREGERSAPLAPGDPGTADNPFAAVMVLKDPTDWFRDLQLILDVVTSSAPPLALYNRSVSSGSEAKVLWLAIWSIGLHIVTMLCLEGSLPSNKCLLHVVLRANQSRMIVH